MFSDEGPKLAKDFRPETLLLAKLGVEISGKTGGNKREQCGNGRSVIFMLSIGRLSQVQGSPRRMQAQASIHSLGLIEK